MIAEEMGCTVTEAKNRVTPQEFIDKITFWETHPPLRDHINICLSQISQLIYNSNLGKRQRPKKMSHFYINYKKGRLAPVETRRKRAIGLLNSLVKKGK